MPLVDIKRYGDYSFPGDYVFDGYEYVYDGQWTSYRVTADGIGITFERIPESERVVIISAPDAGFLIDFSDNVALVNLTGGNRGDVLRGGSGNDLLSGGNGNDVLEGSAGSDAFDGGSGVDTVSYEHSTARVTLFFRDLSQNTGDAAGDTFSSIENIRGSAFDDFIYGYTTRLVVEGGGGADVIVSETDKSTLSYEHSPAGVTVALDQGGQAETSGGDAEGDTAVRFSNVRGSVHSDFLVGDVGNNTLNGFGGADILDGGDGNDRLVISDTPTRIEGGAGKDFLFVTGGGNISLEEDTFTGIEAVYVRNDTHLDMSRVTTGSRIVSQSTSDHGVEIIGTSGPDRIQASKGRDSITGGSGDDKLFAGQGADTFRFQVGFGRDNVYKFDLANDHIDVASLVDDFADMHLRAFHGGQDTLVSFDGAEGTNKIILHDVDVASLTADHFLFGA